MALEALNMKLVYLVNKDLEMSPGKIASQVAHASMLAMRELLKRNGDETSLPVIILFAKEQDMMVETSIAYVNDAGRTEVPAGSLTVVVYLVENNDISFNHLELV